MKKFLYLILVLLVTISFTSVNAASVPYNYIIDGVQVNDSNSDGSATLTKDGKTVTLTLNKFKGKSIKLNCYGTGQSDMKFVFNLVGENTITSDDIGIDLSTYPDGKIEFTGEGSLVINAKKPISYESFENILYVIPNENVYSSEYKKDSTNTSVKENNVTSSEEENTKEKETTTASDDKDDDSNVIKINKNDILLYSFVGYVILSLLIISALVFKIKKLESK